MVQEIQEQLEKGNNQKQCQFYLQKARELFYGSQNKQKKWKDVLVLLNKVLKIDPENTEALAELSNVYGYIGAYVYINKTAEYSKKSFKLLEKALRIDPTYKRALLYQAIEYFYDNKKEKAFELARKIPITEISWEKDCFVDIYI